MCLRYCSPGSKVRPVSRFSNSIHSRACEAPFGGCSCFFSSLLVSSRLFYCRYALPFRGALPFSERLHAVPAVVVLVFPPVGPCHAPRNGFIRYECNTAVREPLQDSDCGTEIRALKRSGEGVDNARGWLGQVDRSGCPVGLHVGAEFCPTAEIAQWENAQRRVIWSRDPELEPPTLITHRATGELRA